MTDFEDVYDRYFKDVFLFIKGMSGDDVLSEEIAQETFFKAIKSIDNYKGNCDIRVWLCQIAKNTYYTYCKTRKRTVGEESLQTVTDTFIFEEKLVDNDEAFKIHQFLHTMGEPYKEVFLLRVFGELSFLQIGKIFCKTESWARVTYHRAKTKIINYKEGQNE